MMQFMKICALMQKEQIIKYLIKKLESVLQIYA